MQVLIALGVKLFEVLLRVLLIPEINEWKRKREFDRQIRDLAIENRKKEEAYENAKPDNSHTEFSKLP